ncbi:MAG TPA: YceD family protein [Verrucomicrobiae bacterium]|nr:YceD family protein [Verrucomicrobiae bacterium]
MPLLVNLRHLEADDVHIEGELPPEELDIETGDEMIRVTGPLAYDLEAQKFEEGLLLQGQLRLPLECRCVRCLKTFSRPFELLEWVAHLHLQGEEAVALQGDYVDLTPRIREDILLEFPQHPLCDPECRGLPGMAPGAARSPSSAGQASKGLSEWDELNKLKF